MRSQSKKTKRPGVFVSLAGGVGNQLFQISAGLALSKNGEISLITDLGKPNKNDKGMPVSLELFPDHYFPLNTDQRFTLLDRKVHNLILRTTKQRGGSNHLQVRWYVHQFLLVVSKFFFKNFCRVISPYDAGYESVQNIYEDSVLLIGYFQSEEYWIDGLDKRIRNHMKLQAESPEVDELQRLSKVQSPLVVHVRAGDYLQFPKFGTITPNYYKKAIEYQWKLGKYKSIWVFTNSPNSIDEYIPEEYLRYAKIIDIHDGSAAHNLEVMRFGHGYVVSNSTYSWWGAYLSYNQNSVVIAPDVWFKVLPEPRNLIPTKWIRLEAKHV